MQNYKNKIFTIVSLDKDVGGISTMIEFSTKIISSKIKKVNLFLLKNTKTTKLIKNNFSNNNKVDIYEITFLEKIIFKFGKLSKNLNNKILNSDLVLLHNAKLIDSFTKFYNIKPLVLFFHTDKEKQIKKMRYVNKVFTVNSYMQNTINSFFNKEKAFLLPNCTYNKNYKNYFNLTKNKKFRVGTMCRLVEKKGIGLLIKVFKEIPDMELMIAGDGPLMEDFRRLIKGNTNIKLLGWIKNKEKFFSDIDVFCSSSTIEPFGLVILEAMARGVPVVSTDCNGPKDIIKNYNNGILFSKENFCELKDCLYKLKNNISLRKKLSKNGLDTIKYNYTIEIYKKNLFSLLDDL